MKGIYLVVSTFDPFGDANHWSDVEPMRVIFVAANDVGGHATARAFEETFRSETSSFAVRTEIGGDLKP